jgi:transcriptional regulator with XRE-family HTH domain
MVTDFSIKKTKKYETLSRSMITDDQYSRLYKSFYECRNPTYEVLKEFATEIKVPIKLVRRWFAVRRKTHLRKKTLNDLDQKILLKELNEIFEINHKPDKPTRIELAEKHGVTVSYVTQWFGQRRWLYNNKQ